MTNSTAPQRRRQGQDGRYPEKTSDFATSNGPDRSGRPDRNDRSDRPERADRSGRPERPSGGRPERSDRSDRPDRGGRPERPSGGRPERPGSGRPERPSGGRSERPSGGRPERSDRNDRSDRSGRPERPGKPGGFTRSDRPERSDRPFRPDRPFRDRFDKPAGNGRADAPDEADRPFTPRPPRGASIIAEVCELDRDLIKLIARRSRLLAKLPARQPGSGNSDNERDLRLAWEKNAARVSRDPRLIRQLFALLGEIEVAPADMEQAPAFNLAPSQKPLEIDLPAPASDRRVRLAMSLAAGAGNQLDLRDVPLNAPVMENLKMWNQTGANLRWEEDGRILCREAGPVAGFGTGRGGRGGDVLDKVIHAGDDALNLFLLVFLMTTRLTRLKIIGEGALKLADLSPLRRFLPQLGARLTAVIPGREGLPARLETSALLPAELVVPDDLPYDAAVALCLSLAFWDNPVSASFAARSDAETIFDEILPLLQEAGVHAEREGERLSIRPGKVLFPESPVPGIHLAASAALLAMPAFAGGSATLRGPWERLEQGIPQREKERLAALFALLRQAGLSLEEKGEALVSRRPEGAIAGEDIDVLMLPVELFPIGLALSLLPLVKKGGGKLPSLPEGMDMALLDDFLLQVGLVRQSDQPGTPELEELESQHGEQEHEEQKGLSEQEGQSEQRGPEGEKPASEMLILAPAGSPSAAPWAAPTPEWALALALAAFLRPHVKLSNPGIVTAQAPDFWNIYNSLPAPVLRPKTPENVSGSVPESARPARRRVFAGYMPESERPEPLPYDEDE